MKHGLACGLFGFVTLALAGCAGEQEEVYTPASSPACSKGAAVESSQVDVAYFGGSWVGKGCQSDGPCWSIQVTIDADEQGRPIGSIAYPSVPCRANLEFVRWESGDVAAFRERFDNPGRCVPDGWLRLRLVNENRMNFVWSFPDGRVDAGTTLERVR